MKQHTKINKHHLSTGDEIVTSRSSAVQKKKKSQQTVDHSTYSETLIPSEIKTKTYMALPGWCINNNSNARWRKAQCIWLCHLQVYVSSTATQSTGVIQSNRYDKLIEATMQPKQVSLQPIPVGPKNNLQLNTTAQILKNSRKPPVILELPNSNAVSIFLKYNITSRAYRPEPVWSTLKDRSRCVDIA